MSELNIYWGDVHDNVFQRPDCPVSLAQNLAYAQAHLDFYAPAMYVAEHREIRALDGSSFRGTPCTMAVERWKDDATLERQWRELEEQTRVFNAPGRFVTFPGYEWQGDGTAGDHNVIFRREGGRIAKVATLAELYASLRGQDALAIPHHTAYRPGARGKDWSGHDETLSPFVEIYSVHGCSETDEECCGLRINPKMGPSVTAGTYQAALDRGCHVGAIGSSDGMGFFPGLYNWGLMACLAPELTRAALWDAFRQRRVYGVTGDRIKLGFSVNGAPLGSLLAVGGPRAIRVEVTGCDALDRVEILRNGRVIHTHAHQGTWRQPPPGQRSRFKFRLETGWGPFAREIGEQPPREWSGSVSLAGGGRILGYEPCWTCGGHERPVLSGDRSRLTLRTPQLDPGLLPVSRFQNAVILELEATPDNEVALDIGGLCYHGTVAALCAESRVLANETETGAVIRERFGLDLASFERPTLAYLYAHKVKLHRAIPAVGYTTVVETVDAEPLTAETHYRVRVEQRNGQKAWSSPIWVRPEQCRRRDRPARRR